MVENAQKMRCGNCGHEDFKIFSEPMGLIVECCKCNSTSTVRVSTPKIVIDWGEKSEGILSAF